MVSSTLCPAVHILGSQKYWSIQYNTGLFYFSLFVSFFFSLSLFVSIPLVGQIASNGPHSSSEAPRRTPWSLRGPWGASEGPRGGPQKAQEAWESNGEDLKEALPCIDLRIEKKWSGVSNGQQ